MKKKLFFLPLVAALALSSCTSDEPAGGGNESGSSDAHYLAVSIVSTPNADSRGEGDQYPGEPGATYEDGYKAENTITAVRFYFYNANEEAVSVKSGKTVNYYDWDNPEGTLDEGNPNIEKQLNAVLLIETNKGDQLPSRIVAVVNPNKDVLGTTSLALQTLRDKVADFAKVANDDSRFVMTNSVYMTAAKKKVESQVIDADCYQKNADDAKTHPVVIYVERTMAKVRVKSGITTDSKGLIQLKDEKGNYIQVLKETTTPTTPSGGGEQTADVQTTKQDVYVKLNGWNVTATLPGAYLSKHIESSWQNDHLAAGIQWNYPAYFRSYWAAACAYSGANQYIDFNKIGLNFNAGTPQSYTYCNENAERTTQGREATKVIISATLCDADGNPLTISEYGGVRMVDNTTFDYLRDRYLFMLRGTDGHSYYKKTTEADGSEIYTEISRNDITFKTAAAAGKVTLGKDPGAYYVFACLTDAAANAEWHTSDAKDNTETITAATINQRLLEQNHAKIWNTGMAYYYTDIMHIHNKPGVVRNHIYDINLNGITGLGTPVYNPNEVIYPERPVDEDTYIAAKIDILSWRVVTNNVSLVSKDTTGQQDTQSNNK